MSTSLVPTRWVATKFEMAKVLCCSHRQVIEEFTLVRMIDAVEFVAPKPGIEPVPVHPEFCQEIPPSVMIEATVQVTVDRQAYKLVPTVGDGAPCEETTVRR